MIGEGFSNLNSVTTGQVGKQGPVRFKGKRSVPFLKVFAMRGSQKTAKPTPAHLRHPPALSLPVGRVKPFPGAILASGAVFEPGTETRRIAARWKNTALFPLQGKALSPF